MLPLEFRAGESAVTLGLSGHEEFRFTGVAALAEDGPLPRTIRVFAGDREFETIARIDTPFERDVFLAGGILPYTLRRLARDAYAAASVRAFVRPRSVSDAGVSSSRRKR